MLPRRISVEFRKPVSNSHLAAVEIPGSLFRESLKRQSRVELSASALFGKLCTLVSTALGAFLIALQPSKVSAQHEYCDRDHGAN
ncbi:hypothetical protein WI61_24900 [Burkholderia cepacia]|nr:hypothetical protein WI48_17225 [Burkholderia cepacia]KVA62480.1 hypothetical protein WI47_03715 [Burkholderia cepacia]KVA70921.1 hypothetical protein WI49_05495 [Burkholderia cepacia]KVA89419.1 hypothetical protein WI50_11380 [Burkholderia cepacia]KVA95170.1 hypothetical protein WI51_38790 [Burkholderia cepacia]